jgi:hypothetical protein
MLARIDDVEGNLIGVLRTYLRRNGSGKASVDPVKAILGGAAGGGVRLGTASGTLMIGEGIETCLSAMQVMDLPAWATIGTAGMTGLVVPSIVKTVIILVDHDRHGAGERAARVAADCWLAEGRIVRFAMPPEEGTDFNDLLVGLTDRRPSDVSP